MNELPNKINKKKNAKLTPSPKKHSPKKHKRRSTFDEVKDTPVVSIFTEKGGVSKTTFTFFATQSDFLNKKKILVVDADPQSNYSHCYLSPSMIREIDFENLEDIMRGTQNKIRYNPWPNIDTIVGCQIAPALEAHLKSELSPGSLMQSTVDVIINRFRTLFSTYDIVFIDMNPTYSTVNEILLKCSNNIVSLVTCDLFSQGSISKLLDFIDFHKLNVNLYLIPSMMIYRGSDLRPAYKEFDNKIIAFIKEQHINNKKYLKYIGVLRRVDDLARKKLIECIYKPSCRDGNIVLLQQEVNDMISLICLKESFDLALPQSKFKWVATNVINCKKPDTILYLLKDNDKYKIGITTNFENRLNEVNNEYKTNWTPLRLYLTTKNIALEVENKILTYFSKDSDQGESFKSNIFHLIVPLFDKRSFIENLLLEI
jgi:cellulose biosynthesis protein BcsQ